jgi:hypothetical protein
MQLHVLQCYGRTGVQIITSLAQNYPTFTSDSAIVWKSVLAIFAFVVACKVGYAFLLLSRFSSSATIKPHTVQGDKTKTTTAAAAADKPSPLEEKPLLLLPVTID